MYTNTGNIRMLAKDNTVILGYAYDALNRLMREYNFETDTAYDYTYDNAGNILTKTTTVGTTVQSTVNYGYSTSEWGDLLTNYNGTTINYDAIGNPLNWRNATSMTWDKRQLERLDINSSEWLLYSYNSDGIRTQKYYIDTDEQVFYDHRYVLDGSTILRETIERVTPDGSGFTTLYYYYDESGISGVSYNGTKYSYIRNLQGDVIGIINDYGVTVVEYKYDAWGNILSTTGSLASTLGAVNPFRYRGYYYDTETGFYYLNSRYYDPQMGRFLNADGIIGANGGIMGYNMFAYCNNNPVHFYDPCGTECICLTKRVSSRHVCENDTEPQKETNPVKFIVKKKATKINRIVNIIEDMAKPVDMTASAGICASGTPSIISFSGQVGVSVDTKGNFAIQASISDNFTTGTPSASASFYTSITNAPTVFNLEEMGCQAGWSSAVPISKLPVALATGQDLLLIPDIENNDLYFGALTSVGISTPTEVLSGEVHVGISHTFTLFSFNIFNVFDDVYSKIMEW